MIERFIVKEFKNGMFNIWDSHKNDWYPDSRPVGIDQKTDLEEYCEDVLNHNYTESLSIKHDFVSR